MRNFDVRKAAKESGVCFWEIASHLGFSEPTMTRKMRFELPAAEKEKMLCAIDEIAKSRA